MVAGKKVGGYLYIQKSALASISTEAVAKVRQAEDILGDVEWNVAKCV